MYFFPSQKQSGYREIVKIGRPTPYVGMGLLTLGGNEAYQGRTGKEEMALVILSGVCNVEVGGQSYRALGGRQDVFSGPATAIYVPVDSTFSVTEAGGAKLEIAVTAAVAEKQYAPFVVRPDEVQINHRGLLNWQRDVHDIMVANGENRVDRIVVGETFSYSGQWSSYPSHKHDEYNPPYENKMDEIYLFKIKPAEGFGVQVLYNDELSLREAFMLKDGDVMAIPGGYHPVAAAPGYQLYYLWVMAGSYGRKLIPKDDPNLRWIGNIGPMLQGR